LIPKDILFPIGMVAALFGLAILLTLAGHRKQLQDRSRDVDVSESIIERIIYLHQAASGENLSVSASSALNRRHGISGHVAEAAFRVLLELKGHPASARTLASQGRFLREGRQVVGLDQTADLVFGANPEILSDAEIGLFCNWVVNGQDSWGPDAILSSREFVLRRMLTKRAITDEQYQSLNTKSLALRPTPIPIN
jgi:hypothetical protein